MVIIQIVDETDGQELLLFDGEGPHFTARKIGKNHFQVSTREKIVQPLEKWTKTLSDWCGLYVFEVRTSKRVIINQLQNFFGCEVLWCP